jgi:hypothetical protein
VSAFGRIDNELVRARTDARRLEKLTRDLEAARRELAQEQAKVHELAHLLAVQERGVRRLEGRGLRRWLMEAAGPAGRSWLDLQRRETAVAKLQHDAARQVAAGLADEVARLETERAALGDPYARYEAALAEKERLHTDRGDTLGQQLLELSAQRANGLANRRELDETIEAGNEVLAHLGVLAMALQRAGGFGLWDILGGGMFVSMVKIGYIDDARSVAAGLQEKILRFDRGLADVAAAAGVEVGKVKLGLGMRFADVFLDGLLPDLLVQTRILNARNTVDRTAAYVLDVLKWLGSLVDYTDDVIRSCDQQRIELLERY